MGLDTAASPVFEKFFSKDNKTLQTHVTSVKPVHHAEFTAYRGGPVYINKVVGATKCKRSFVVFDIVSELTDLNGHPLYDKDRLTFRQLLRGKATDKDRAIHTRLWEWICNEGTTEWLPPDAWASLVGVV